MWWTAVEPECVFVYGGGEEGGFVVDLLACLEEGGLDAFGLFVAWSVVEGVLAVEMGVDGGLVCIVLVMVFIVGGVVVVVFIVGCCWTLGCGDVDILGFQGKGVDAVADFWREDGEEEAGILLDCGK